MINKVVFDGIVRLDDQGELLCFCYKEDFLRGECSCVATYDCPEALIEISIIPGTRPSDKVGAEVKKVFREMENNAGKIKQSISALERELKKKSRFPI